MSNSTEEFYGKSSIKGIVLLFTYFFIILILGLTVSIFSLFISLNSDVCYIPLICNSFDTTKGLNIYILSLIGSIGSSLLGDSVYYIRKLYKLSLGDKFLFKIETSQDKIENFGTLMYFISRPFFSISFSILILIGIKSGMFILTGKPNSFNSNVIEVIMFINYFTGFSTGKFLETLESKSDKVIKSLFGENSK